MVILTRSTLNGNNITFRFPRFPPIPLVCLWRIQNLIFGYRTILLFKEDFG